MVVCLHCFLTALKACSLMWHAMMHIYDSTVNPNVCLHNCTVRIYLLVKIFTEYLTVLLEYIDDVSNDLKFLMVLFTYKIKV